MIYLDKNKMMNPKRVLNYFIPAAERTQEILQINPTIDNQRVEAENIAISVYDYNPGEIHEYHYTNIEPTFKFKDNRCISWINLDGIRKPDIELICDHFGIHPLLVEDILSVGQRPKMDEVEGVLFCLLNMLYYNADKNIVETEQISIVLGSDFVLSIQEDSSRDVFNPLRVKLSLSNSKIRQRGADYILYSMLDLIVDNYFLVMESLVSQIELLEEEIVQNSKANQSHNVLQHINQLRKELIILKRNIMPVRDLIAGIIRSESELLDDKITKYFKDIQDHIIQAFELSENYSDMLVGLQDLYISNVNLKLNNVMKVMTIVTCLLAPATVIGGVFGMNFDVIPYSHHQSGFYFAVSSMLIIPLIMLRIFKKRGWF